MADDVVAATQGPAKGGTETILIAADDDEVRAMAVGMLVSLGYWWQRPEMAGSALSIIESGIPIDLLFTELVMPGTLRSPELARKAKERLPGLAVLFTSGYAENGIVHGGPAGSGGDRLDQHLAHRLARQPLAFSLPPDITSRSQYSLANVAVTVRHGPNMRRHPTNVGTM